MFGTVFNSILRCVAIPIVSFILLQKIFEPKEALLIVAIALTLTNILSIIWQLIKAIPNLVLLRAGSLIKIFIRIFFEVASIIGFWAYYLMNYN